MKDKQFVLQTINRLPDDTIMEEIAEELQNMAAIRKGKADVKVVRVKSHCAGRKTV